MPTRRSNRHAYSFGYTPDTHDPRDFRLASASPFDPLPKQVDNRPRVRRILDQNPEGACTGFAVCAAAELLFGLDGPGLDLSERWAYHHARRYDPWPGENYSGTTLRAALEGWLSHGLCEEAYWPFEPYLEPEDARDFDVVAWEKAPREGAEANARRHPLTAYFRLANNFEIKRAIYKNHVALIGAKLHTGWLTWGADKIRFEPGAQRIGLHAFIAVGYDDADASFHVVNSWGPEWGQHGFGRLGYEDLNINMIDAWTAVVPRAPTP